MGAREGLVYRTDVSDFAQRKGKRARRRRASAGLHGLGGYRTTSHRGMMVNNLARWGDPNWVTVQFCQLGNAHNGPNQVTGQDRHPGNQIRPSLGDPAWVPWGIHLRIPREFLRDHFLLSGLNPASD